MMLHKKRYRVIPFVLSLLIVAFGVVWMFRTPNNTKDEAASGRQQKLTVAEFREKRQEFKKKYPAIPVWDNRNVAETVKMLNYAIEQHADGEDKSRDEVLADMNMLLEKWGPRKKLQRYEGKSRESRDSLRNYLKINRSLNKRDNNGILSCILFV